MTIALIKVIADVPSSVIGDVGVSAHEEGLFALNAGLLTGTLLLACAFALLAAFAAAAAAPGTSAVSCRGGQARKFGPVFALRKRCEV